MSNNTKECEESVIDFTKVKLERGQTPHDIQQKCLDLCRDYLGGVWLQLTADDIDIKRLSGGLTNQSYICAVNQNKEKSDEKESEKVVIRLYGEKHFHNSENNRLNDSIISLMVSENGLGPKIYGLFESGQLQKYYPSKEYRPEVHNDPKIIIGLAQSLARIHAMDVPIKKTGNWLFDYYDESFKTANERFDIKSLIQESRSETLAKYDLNVEIEWLKRAVVDIDSPIMFSHVDFRGPNILITESNDIVVCDFEVSCYGYRGFDFGSFFVECGRDLTQYFLSVELPSDQFIETFIKSYIEESVKLRGKQFSDDDRNSYQHIMKEVKVFCLAELMWVILFFLKVNESIINEIPFNKLKSMKDIESNYKTYHCFKQNFFDGNILKSD